MKDFKIGADPEFSVIDSRKSLHSLIEAEDFLERSPLRHDGEGPLGADGNGRTFEIRPGPSLNPLQVVANIHGIFAQASNQDHRLFGLSWRAGSCYGDLPLGGHIHFGTAEMGLRNEQAMPVLDSYVGVLGMLIENKVEAIARRKAHGYGCSNNFRRKEWGFEYRCPSSWLTSPYVAAAILCLAKTVLNELVNPPGTSVLKDYTRGGGEVYSPIDKCDFKWMGEQFSHIWEDVTRMQLYQTYKPYIDLIYRLVDKRLTWFPATTMKAAWGVADTSVPLPKRMGLDTIWNRYRQETLHTEGEHNHD